MTPEELKQKVDAVIALSDEDEMAHGAEDGLHLEIIQRFCPDWVMKEIDRLSEADFSRWCA